MLRIRTIKFFKTAVLLLALSFFSFNTSIMAQEINNGVPQVLAETPLVVISGDTKHTFTVQVANTNKQHQIGLMWVREMADDKGMLFQYSIPQKMSFWMKNTFISLDLIYIQTNGTIANIQANAEPHNLNGLKSKGRVLGVFEINGGLAAKLGIKAGDKVLHPMFKNWPAK